MIRIGSGTNAFSTRLNRFHSQSPLQTSGLYTNITSAAPPSEGTIRFGLTTVIPPFPSSLKDYTLCVYRSVLVPPVTVSSSYLEVEKNTDEGIALWTITRMNGYSSQVLQELPLSGGGFSFGTNMVMGDVSYIRLGDVLPIPQQFTWKHSLEGSVGLNPDYVFVYETDKVQATFINPSMSFRPFPDTSRHLVLFELHYGTDLLVTRTVALPGESIVPEVGVDHLTDFGVSSSILSNGAHIYLLMTEP